MFKNLLGLTFHQIENSTFDMMGLVLLKQFVWSFEISFMEICFIAYFISSNLTKAVLCFTFCPVLQN